MGRIGDQQPQNRALLRALDYCRCGSRLLMFGCENERCANNNNNKMFFYNERIKSQEELDEYWKQEDGKNEK